MRTFKVAVSGVLVLASCGKAPVSTLKEAWNEENDPIELLDADWTRKLSSLPLKGSLSQKPWTDSYWPTAEGGIAKRWQKESADSWTYSTPNRFKLALMSLAERAKLSPAEKFDIINGDFDYPTVAEERKRTSRDTPQWFGICHGWAAASINYSEPKATLINGSGLSVSIPFGSSDIKALLSYHQGVATASEGKYLGGRCEGDFALDAESKNLPECRDTNAGAFHLVLTNMIGLRDQGFLADVARDYQVWNHPIHSFHSRIIGTQAPSAGAAPGTVIESIVETKMTYTIEIYPQWQEQGAQAGSDVSVTYRYRLEQNSEGEIIGGEWLSEKRPDFLWLQKKSEFEGKWRGLEMIYDTSLSGTSYPRPDQKNLLERIFGGL